MNMLFFLCGFITVVFVLFITVYLIISGLPAIREIGLVEFLFGTKWASTASEPSFGILPFILTSIYGTAGAILLGVPVGFMTAVFLAKIAPSKPGGRGTHGGGPAGRHSLRGLRPDRHDGAGTRGARGVPPARRGQPGSAPSLCWR